MVQKAVKIVKDRHSELISHAPEEIALVRESDPISIARRQESRKVGKLQRAHPNTNGRFGKRHGFRGLQIGSKFVFAVSEFQVYEPYRLPRVLEDRGFLR